MSFVCAKSGLYTCNESWITPTPMNGNDPKHIKLFSATSSNYTVFHTAWTDEGWETFAENLAMQWRMYHWASRKSFSSVAEIFPKAQIIAWVLLFRCKPWLFSWGFCSKLFSLHLTRSFELRKVYILLWIWRMRKSYQVEGEHSVRFWFEYLISGLKRYRTFEKRTPSWSKGG